MTTLRLTDWRRDAPSWLTSYLDSPRQDELHGLPEGANLTLSDFRHFFDTEDIPDNVHGRVFLSRFEIDLVDTPEFQRLFRVSQMGAVELLFPTANHRRGTHSIGTCGLAKEFIYRMNGNADLVNYQRREYGGFCISLASSIVIAAAALLHDLPHGPYSHDIERRSHKILNDDLPTSRHPDERIVSHCGPYYKHDDFTRNPALFLMLTDQDHSTIARILSAYSRSFWLLLQIEQLANKSADWELGAFVTKIKTVGGSWDPAEELLPQLIMHTLAGEKSGDFRDGKLTLAQDWACAQTRPIGVDHVQSRGPTEAPLWGLGPRDSSTSPVAARELHDAWYQPYRHDIIGDTLSADLLDYLPRDCRGLALSYTPDDRFLDHLILASQVEKDGTRRFVCALDLTDQKRGALRMELPEDLFDLLDARFEVHQKAVLHRVVQAVIAMLWRSTRLLKSPPRAELLYGWLDGTTDGERLPKSAEDRVASRSDSVVGSQAPSGDPASHALYGDEKFLDSLLRQATAEMGQNQSGGQQAGDGSWSLITKIIERRLYKPLLSLRGDDVPDVVDERVSLDRRRDEMNRSKERVVRAFGALLDSPAFCAFFREIEFCVEAILSHAYSADEILSYLRNLQSFPTRDPGREQSKRVIVWAPPFKQFYKDPSIRITYNGRPPKTLEDIAGGIDIGRNGDGHSHPDPEQSEDLLLRVQAGIANADAKYRSAWSASVFMSDGLFYRGARANICSKVCPTDDSHQNHLQSARLLVLAALRAAYHFWRDKQYDSRHDWIEAGDSTEVHPLERALTADDLKHLLDSVAWLYEDFSAQVSRQNLQRAAPRSRRPLRLATARSHYIHGMPDPNSLVPAGEHCRDLKYKFAKLVDFQKLSAQFGSLPEVRRTYIEGLFHNVFSLKPLISAEDANEIQTRMRELTDEAFLELSTAVTLADQGYGSDISDRLDQLLGDLWRRTSGIALVQAGRFAPTEVQTTLPQASARLQQLVTWAKTNSSTADLAQYETFQEEAATIAPGHKSSAPASRETSLLLVEFTALHAERAKALGAKEKARKLYDDGARMADEIGEHGRAAVLDWQAILLEPRPLPREIVTALNKEKVEVGVAVAKWCLSTLRVPGDRTPRISPSELENQIDLERAKRGFDPKPRRTYRRQRTPPDENGPAGDGQNQLPLKPE